MDAINAYQDLLATFEAINECVSQIVPLARDCAEKERAYRIKKHDLVLNERAKGTPVTVISDLVRGDRACAKLAFEHACADSLCTANQEQIYVLKKQADFLRELLIQESSRAR